MRSETRRGRPRKIQPEEVVAVASELIERDGLQRFSMRALGEAMDVRPMAFYTHFANKDALLDAVADRYLDAVELPVYEARWDQWVFRFGVALRDAWTAHPRLLTVLMARPGQGSAVAELVETFLATLVSAGFTPALAHSAWHAVQSHVFGEVYQQAAWGSQPRLRSDAPERRVAAATDQQPLLSVLAVCDPAAEFRIGLELIVDGLRIRREHPGPHDRRP